MQKADVFELLHVLRKKKSENPEIVAGRQKPGISSGRQAEMIRDNVMEISVLADSFQVDALMTECTALLNKLPKRKSNVSLGDLLNSMNKSQRMTKERIGLRTS